MTSNTVTIADRNGTAALLPHIINTLTTALLRLNSTTLAVTITLSDTITAVPVLSCYCSISSSEENFIAVSQSTLIVHAM
jgi:hypothetical protein